jgi:hypothetical protein
MTHVSAKEIANHVVVTYSMLVLREANLLNQGLLEKQNDARIG